MRRMVFALIAVATLAGCTNTEKGAVMVAWPAVWRAGC